MICFNLIRQFILLIALFTFSIFAYSIQTNYVLKNSSRKVSPIKIPYGSKIGNVESVSIKDLKSLEKKLIAEINQRKNNWEIFNYVIPVLVTLIAGWIALFQVKSNTISKARIVWTENLRNTISEYLSIMIHISDRNHMRKKEIGKRAKNTQDQEDKLIEFEFDKIEVSNKLANKIKLYLNSAEPEHKILEDLIDNFEKSLYQIWEHPNNTIEIQENIEKRIIEQSKVILKNSWEDAKVTKWRYLLKFKLK